MNDDRNPSHPDRLPTGRLDEAAPDSRAHRPGGPGQASPSSTHTAGLRPGSSPGSPDREITGELDRAVNAPDHGKIRDR
jgi:hypothetical protein